MLRIKYFSNLFTAALLVSLCAVAVSAQVAQGSGRVTLRQADGTVVPVQNAVVIFYRTDIKGKFETKTNKDGRYVHAALPYSGKFTIVVSAPGAQPTFLPNVPVSQSPENNFTLEPGDGSTLTLEQVQAAAAASSASGASGATAGGGNSAAARRAAEEEAKRRAAYEEEKRKAEATNVNLNEILKTANAAFKDKKYDEAIAAYDQGIQADPGQGVFYLNKSVALRARGLDKYNAGVKGKDTAGITAGKEDLKAAAEMSEKAVTAYRQMASQGASSGGATAAPSSGGAQSAELDYLSTRAENYRLAMRVGAGVEAETAAKAIQEYVAVETDATKKDKAQASLADALFQSGKTEEAIASFRQILAANPNNLDAMYGLGLALSGDISKAAEARELLQRFASKAPATDERKQLVPSIVAEIEQAAKADSSRPANTDGNRGRATRRRP